MRVKKGLNYQFKDGRSVTVTSFNILEQEVTIQSQGVSSTMDYQSFKAQVADTPGRHSAVPSTSNGTSELKKGVKVFRLRNDELATITKMNKTRVCYRTESGRENEVTRKEYDALVEGRHIELL